MLGIDFIDDLRARPNSALAIERYRKNGCWMLPVVPAARWSRCRGKWGPTGRVLGIEQSPEMAAIARQRLEDAGIAHAEIVTADVRVVSRPFDADAVLCTFTHDVLQSPGTVARIGQLSKSSARIAELGAPTLSWWWGWPVNLFLMWRDRRYLSTFHGLGNRCARLAPHCAELEFKGAWHVGTSYLKVGRFLAS